MANRHDKPLPEIELPRYLASETLSLILHTIILLRAPKTLSMGVDVVEFRLEDLDGVYQKLKYAEVSKNIDEQVDVFFKTGLTDIGPDLSKGSLSLCFHVNKPTNSWFGPKTEKVTFERWSLPVLINTTPRPLDDSTASVIERNRTRVTSQKIVADVMARVYDLSLEGLESLPREYQYDIAIGGAEESTGGRDSFTRMAGMPMLFNT
ncbi:hypothetical protein TrVE_jg5710 [Triparma verrucosa]|uniref:Autophagy-related protein 101 n=1 Tax=Triparma verrucosa TaxID=1606542 RepID=A0A9W7CK34_9STRA|nr:hypothetical protein TrVE_jg5710 [Triparma verrucosa]